MKGNTVYRQKLLGTQHRTMEVDILVLYNSGTKYNLSGSFMFLKQ
jgi:hypothetical protein